MTFLLGKHWFCSMLIVRKMMLAVVLGGSKSKVGGTSKPDKKASNEVQRTASPSSGCSLSQSTPKSSNEANSLKTSKQLFKENDRSLSVTLNLDCCLGNAPLSDPEKIPNPSAANAQKEAVRKKPNVAKDIAQVKQVPVKDLKVSLNQTSFSPGPSSSPDPAARPNATDTQHKASSFAARQAVPTPTSKSVAAASRASVDATSHKHSFAPPTSKHSAKKVSAKVPDAMAVPGLNQLSAELLKYAMMEQPAAAQQLPVDSRMFAMLPGLGYPAVLPTSSPAGPSVEELHSFLSAMQSSGNFPTFAQNTTKNSPPPNTEHLRPPVPKKGVLSYTPKQTTGLHATNESTRPNQVVAKSSSRASHSNNNADIFKIPMNGSGGFLEPVTSNSSSASANKSKMHHKSQPFVTSDASSPFLMTPPSTRGPGDAPHNAFHPKSRTSPQTVSSGPPLLVSSSPTARSSATNSAAAAAFSSLYTFHPTASFPIGSQFASASLSGSSGSRAPSNSSLSSVMPGISDQFLAFNQLVDAVPSTKVSCGCKKFMLLSVFFGCYFLVNYVCHCH